MIDIAGTLAQSLLSGFCMLLLASCCCALFYPIFNQLLGKLSIANQALLTLCYGLIAPLCALLGLVVLTHPAISATVVYAHCHGHNCAAHVPAPIMTSLTGAGMGALATLAVVLLCYVMSKSVHSARARLLFLDSLAKPEAQSAVQPEKARLKVNRPLHYKLIESEDHIAWCAGLLFPKVYVSSGLVNKLDQVQLSAVLAHEYGHVSRYDNLRKLLLSWSTALWLPAQKDTVQQDFSAKTEQLSDLYSAQITGDPLLINSIYAQFCNYKITQKKDYAHRNLANHEQSQTPAPTSILSTMLVYLLCSLLFVGLTVGITIAAHVLLENI